MAAAGVWLAPAPVRGDAGAAPGDRADELLREGIALRDQGRTDAACARFEVSARLRAAPRALFEFAACREAAGALGEAMWWFRAAARAAADAHDRELAATVADRVARIARTSAKVTIDTSAVEPGAWVSFAIDGRMVGGAWLERGLYLPAGRHRLLAVRPGCARFERSFVAESSGEVALRVPALGCAPASASRGRRGVIRVGSEAGPRRNQRLFTAGAWTAALGGVAIGVGFGYRNSAGNWWSDARATGCDSNGNCSSDDGRALVANARAAEHRAWTAFALGGAAGVVGVTCLIVGGRRRDPAPSAVAVVPIAGDASGAFITVGGSF